MLLVVVGVIAAVLIAAGVAIAQLGSGDKPTSQSPPTADHSAHNANQPAPTASASEPVRNVTGRATVDACTAEIRTTEAVVAAARTAAGHWREHVQARTDLLSGKNSEEVTKAIWKRTRLAGPGDIAALHAALTAQARSAGGCAKLTGSTAAACKQRMAVLGRVATADRAAAADWAHHLSMMAAHAAGDFGAEHAQELWVAAWSSAPKNLNAAARANAALATAPVCRPA